MARARAAEHQRPRSRTALIEEATLGIAKLQEVAAVINDLSQEGFPYRDAAQSKAELQFRECLRHAFGERSQEFQTYRNFKLRTADKAEVAQSLAAIKGLIHTLEDRKLELQGLKPAPKPEPPPVANLSNTADGDEQGENEGVEQVSFAVKKDGTPVFETIETRAAYCIFGGNGPCNPWTSENGVYKWSPGGAPVEPGEYEMEIFATLNGEQSRWAVNFTLSLP